ncbi:hypothetical protein SeLEV6574_g03219 [Synchytrium endobioticum]|uniref:Autophagy-related protein 14 n=1 Tax=Synchytrium endobioticum TaxID=286115 RepID=A0A507D4N8_9FUNG|nr:hypothetical protein SeLEV6574_g03219 [Synchytrium endobioticum]
MQYMQEQNDGSLECDVCRSAHRRFHCTECLNDKIRSQKLLSDSTGAERQRIADAISSKLVSRPPTGVAFDKLYESKQAHVECLKADIAKTRNRIQATQNQLADLRAKRDNRRQLLANAVAALESGKFRSSPKKFAETKDTKGNAHVDYESLVQCRHEIVRELVSVFKLRKVAARLPPTNDSSVTHRTSPTLNVMPHNHSTSTSLSQSTTTINSTSTSSNTLSALHGAPAASPIQPKVSSNVATAIPTRTTPEYKIVNVSFTCYGDYFLHPPERFNAALGYIIYMTIILAHYLNVVIPYELVWKGKESYVQAHHPGTSNQSPLYLNQENVEEFTVGVAMLNFDISYLCWTQGKLIPLEETPQTLRNLAECCEASKPANQLGKPSSRHRPYINPSAAAPATSYYSNGQPQQHDAFPLKISEVVKLHQRIRKEPNNSHVIRSVPSNGPSVAFGSSRGNSIKKDSRPSMNDPDGLDVAAMTMDDDFVVIPHFK